MINNSMSKPSTGKGGRRRREEVEAPPEVISEAFKTIFKAYVRGEMAKDLAKGLARFYDALSTEFKKRNFTEEEVKELFLETYDILFAAMGAAEEEMEEEE